MGMAACRVFDLRIAIIPVQIREHPTFPPFQIRSDALRNTPQLFRLPLFRSPSLLLFDPGIELKIWISRFHGIITVNNADIAISILFILEDSLIDGPLVLLPISVVPFTASNSQVV